jgi:hypothetical protein
MDVLRSAHDFVKKNKLISRAASALSAAGLPYAGTIGSAASAMGYGRRRRVRRRRHGGNLKSILSSAHKFVKDNRLISKGLRTFMPNSNLHKAAHTLGYGRRRRRRGGNLKSILSGAHKFIKDNRLISKGLRTFMPNSNLHKAAHTLGYGKRRRPRRHAVRMHHRGGANFFTTEQIAAPKFS